MSQLRTERARGLARAKQPAARAGRIREAWQQSAAAQRQLFVAVDSEVDEAQQAGIRLGHEAKLGLLAVRQAKEPALGEQSRPGAALLVQLLGLQGGDVDRVNTDPCELAFCQRHELVDDSRKQWPVRKKAGAEPQ
jgi:hypothetical protein